MNVLVEDEMEVIQMIGTTIDLRVPIFYFIKEFNLSKSMRRL